MEATRNQTEEQNSTVFFSQISSRALGPSLFLEYVYFALIKIDKNIFKVVNIEPCFTRAQRVLNKTTRVKKYRHRGIETRQRKISSFQTRLGSNLAEETKIQNAKKKKSLTAEAGRAALREGVRTPRVGGVVVAVATGALAAGQAEFQRRAQVLDAAAGGVATPAAWGRRRRRRRPHRRPSAAVRLVADPRVEPERPKKTNRLPKSNLNETYNNEGDKAIQDGGGGPVGEAAGSHEAGLGVGRFDAGTLAVGQVGDGAREF